LTFKFFVKRSLIERVNISALVGIVDRQEAAAGSHGVRLEDLYKSFFHFAESQAVKKQIAKPRSLQA
jgi:hypothetical protein